MSADDEVTGGRWDGRLVRRLLSRARPHAGLLAAALALLLVSGLLQLVGPLLTRDVIDVALPGRDGDRVLRDALLMAAALVLQFACGWGETVTTAQLGQRVMDDLRRELFSHVQRLSVPWFDRTPVGRVVTRVTSDVESLNELFTAGVVAAMGDLFTLAAIAVLMLAVDWRLALSAFVVVPGIVLVSRQFRGQVRGAFRDIRGQVAALNAFVQERLGGMRVVQLFGREADERRAFAGVNEAHLRAQQRAIRVYALYFPAVEFLTTLALALLLVAAASRVGAATLTVGTVAAFLQLARRFFQPLQDLSDKYNTLQQALAAAERIFGLLDAPVSVVDEGQASLPPRPAGAGVAVAFEDVWFSYAPEAAEPVWALRGVSFRVEAGQTVALVGHTGAGKSTVIQLLLRFHDPQRGRITVDGVDIRSLSLSSLRAVMGLVQQELFLFAADVATNIRMGAPLDDAAVAATAARVGADAVVARLPGGLRHRLGERGASLSVGERQLLSFARALAADPALLLLDEATSAVDSEVEARIQAALDALRRGRTTVAVAHRLSTIRSADQILVLHRGEVRERGTHAALLALGGVYAGLSRLQQGAPPQAVP